MYRRINLLAAVLLAVSVGVVILQAQSANSSAAKSAKESEFLAAGHERFLRGDFAGARAAYENILEQTSSAPVYRGLALLGIAQTFEREGNLG